MPRGQMRHDPSKFFRTGLESSTRFFAKTRRSAKGTLKRRTGDDRASNIFMTRTVISALDLSAAQAMIAGHPPRANFHHKAFAVMLNALRADRWAPASLKMSISIGRKAIVSHESIVLWMHQNAPHF
jgi:hypothetical protein